MTPPNATQQAIQWLEQQLTDLAGIRNATPRDPSFKNWRQASITVMQRIWPSDQERQERFRRIPFSPADPRADARTVREWYSRGCQEASRVLQGFINDIRAQGAPQPLADVAAKPSSGEFGVDFPTVDLPSGDLGALPAADDMDDLLFGPPSGAAPRLPTAPTHPAPAPIPAPSVFAPAASNLPPPPPAPAPPAPSPEPATSTSSVQVRQSQPKKGMGARLLDLLGIGQISTKAFTGFPREQAPEPPASLAAESPGGLDIIPVGDEPVARPTSSAPPAAPPVSAAPSSPAPSSSGPASPAAGPQPEPGMSVVMSRPTTLRGSIEKVTIESLISPEFRSPEDATPDPLAAPHLRPPGASPEDVAPPASAGSGPAQLPAASAPPPPVAAPSIDSTPVSPSMEVIPPGEALFTAKPRTPAAPTPSGGWPLPTPSSANIPRPTPSQSMPAPTPSQSPAPTPSQKMPAPTPSQSTAPTPSQEMPPPTPSQAMAAPTPSQAMPAPTPSQSMPAPSRADLPRVQPSAIIPMPPIAPVTAETPATPPPPAEEPTASSKVISLPKRGTPERAAKNSEPVLPDQEDHISEEIPVDPEEFAQATEDFMRSSPVLGASGRKVKRGYDRGSDAPSFDDADAIAVAGLMDELAGLGVPPARQPEARARLLDLARRLEKGEFEWAALRKAVWFAMEYPELARRLMPLLLPWIDRAA